MPTGPTVPPTSTPPIAAGSHALVATTADGNVASCSSEAIASRQGNWQQIALGTAGGDPRLPKAGQSTTVTDERGVSVTVSRETETTWTWALESGGGVTDGIDVAVSKAGNRALIHDYRQTEAQSGALTTERGVGHVLLCYDVDEPLIILTPVTPISEARIPRQLTAFVAADQSSGRPAPNAIVTVTKLGGPGTSVAGCVTDTTGFCTVTVSSTEPGIATYSGSAVVSIGGVSRTVGPDDATQRWVDAFFLVTGLPPTGFHFVGEPLTYFVSVVAHDGFGIVAAPTATMSTSGSFQIQSGGGGAPPIEISIPPCGAGPFGGLMCTTAGPDEPGILRINVNVTFTVAGITIQRATPTPSPLVVTYLAPPSGARAATSADKLPGSRPPMSRR